MLNNQERALDEIKTRALNEKYCCLNKQSHWECPKYAFGHSESIFQPHYSKV